jgi:hypothetical protein
MDHEDLSPKPEPTPNRQPIATFDDDGRARILPGTGLALLVNIMRIGRHRERPIIREELNERMRAEVGLLARSLLEEGDGPVACQVKAHCRKILENFEEDGAVRHSSYYILLAAPSPYLPREAVAE